MIKLKQINPFYSEDLVFMLRILDINNYYIGDVVLFLYPTGNCQLASISYFNNILNNVSNKEELMTFFNDLKRSLTNLYNSERYPKQFIIDVQERYAPLVRDYFKIVVDSPYISTNDSRMCLFIVKAP